MEASITMEQLILIIGKKEIELEHVRNQALLHMQTIKKLESEIKVLQNKE